ncbi:MAG: hypothetical protein JO213_07220 [Alphaproteobacteria bacterium]|nr:hypothetical protein [Alphaproteobacteria bacterium]MBV9584659.1 hypothetical protein [Alphaproteobacteria bacterium]
MLKAMVQRERTYTRGYTNLTRLFELGVLERGMVGSPQSVAQDTLDGLDKSVDMLGFLDIVASFEIAALEEIRSLRAQAVGRLREMVRNTELAPAAAGLLQNTDDPSWSLRSTIDVLRLAAHASDTEYLDAINLTRNQIAHGRVPEAVPLDHEELRNLLCRLIEVQLRL